MSAIFIVSVLYNVEAGGGVVVFGLILAMLTAVFATRGIEAEMARVLGFTLTLAYAGFPWLIVWDLYENGPNGMYLILVLAIVWLGDTGGYFGGRFLGRHQLSPNKSPKKTWEGTIGGALLCILIIALLGKFIPIAQKINVIHWISIATLCAVFGTIGDLIESKFKRMANIKDSGSFMPGHGGFLDRFDSLLIATPFVWGYIHFFGSIKYFI
jgi:CDP-diglyceride synthetase